MMSFKGKLHNDGRLTDIVPLIGAISEGEVEVASMPTLAPGIVLGYDPITKRAVPFIEVDLSSAKQAKRDAIDNKTVELISQGYTYSGKVFSQSIEAQFNLAVGKFGGAVPGLFPRLVQTLDGKDTYTVPDYATACEMYDTAVARIGALKDQGAVLVKTVNDAQSIAEVNAVVDNRT